MNNTHLRRIGCTSAAVFVITASACAPGKSLTDAPGSPRGFEEAADSTTSSREAECERELIRLDKLIESSRRDPGIPAAALAESIALRQSALGLLLDGEYELALEFIDEAISLLRES